MDQHGAVEWQNQPECGKLIKASRKWALQGRGRTMAAMHMHARDEGSGAQDGSRFGVSMGGASTNTTADDEQGSRADANSPGWGWSRRACWDGLGMVVGVRRREYRSCRSRTMGGRDVQYLLESRMDLKVRRKAIMTNEVERPMYRPPIYRPTAGNEALNPECQSRIYFGV